MVRSSVSRCADGFNCGSTAGLSTARQRAEAARAAMTTTLAAAAGALAAALPRLVRSRGHTIDILSMGNGLLGVRAHAPAHAPPLAPLRCDVTAPCCSNAMRRHCTMRLERHATLMRLRRIV
jgi:ammonia channel protein AmtB